MRYRHTVRTWALAAVLGLFAGCATTGERRPTTSLWKLETPGHGTVYLMGAIHVLPASALPFPKAFDAAFNEAERVVFEVHPKFFDDPATEHTFTRAGVYPPGDEMKNHVRPETWRFVQAFCRAAGIDEAKAAQMRPWFFAETVQTLFLESRGFSARHGVDVHYAIRSRHEGKRLGGLETVSNQARAASAAKPMEAEILLIGTLLTLRESAEELGRMVKAWRRGDTRKLAAMIQPGGRAHKGREQELFTVRNRRWLPQIERFTREREDTLVIVGAGHLVGPSGLVEMLRAKGYRVTQL